MERIQALIDKLYQQKTQNSSSSQLLLTVQLLHSELILLQQNETLSFKTKVAVTMPVNYNFSGNDAIYPIEQFSKQTNSIEEQISEIKKEEKPLFESFAEVIEEKEFVLSKPAVTYKYDINEDVKPVHPHYAFMNPALETSNDSPTLIQHQVKEIHEVIAEARESLNDRLKQEKAEVVNVFKDAPIRDLRKGIGINDRFTFVSELFRGDEAMYERSIKTINSFNVLSEAEYWINRELKFKLGWVDNKEIVQHFYQLVRRRFS